MAKKENDGMKLTCCCGAMIATTGAGDWVTQRMREFMAVHKDHTPWIQESWSGDGEQGG